MKPVFYVAKDAAVMLTSNLWPSVGLCNGATGCVVDIIYKQGHKPPDLPITIKVKFDDYTGNSISDSILSCVPICPITASTNSAGKMHERQQLPLRLCCAMTIHKSQGLTLQKAWIELGPSESVLGITYVALSSVRTLYSCVIESMSLERLQSIRNSKKFHYRTLECARLKELAEQLMQ